MSHSLRADEKSTLWPRAKERKRGGGAISGANSLTRGNVLAVQQALSWIKQAHGRALSSIGFECPAVRWYVTLGNNDRDFLAGDEMRYCSFSDIYVCLGVCVEIYCWIACLEDYGTGRAISHIEELLDILDMR